MPEPRRNQHQGGLAIGKRPDDTGTAPHLPNDSLQGVIGADLPPVGAGKRVVGQGLTDGLADQGRGLPQLQGSQLRDDRLRLGRGRLPILLGVDRLQHAGDDVELPARDVAEDVPIPVDHTPLPPGLGVALRGGFH